jgi:hypothetical protein
MISIGDFGYRIADLDKVGNQKTEDYMRKCGIARCAVKAEIQ